MSKCKILFLAANPAGTDRLSLDEESRAIEEKIRSAEHRDALELVTKWAVRPDDLLENFNRFKPHVVHFSGHGTEANEIILEDHSRKARPVSAAALKQLFTVLKDNIHVVVLNACFSKAQAEAIVQVIDCAIGMKTEIGDEAAIAFAASFYSAVGYGRSVRDAFEQGKTSLMLHGIPEEDTPTLLVRKGVNPATIFLINQERKRGSEELDEEEEKNDPGDDNPPPPAQLTLNELLPGTWHVQIQGPYGFEQTQLTIFPNGHYHSEQPTPMGMVVDDGQWQANPALQQFWFRGTRTAGFQVIPYEVMTQVTAGDVLWMTGVTNTGAQVRLQRLSPPPMATPPAPSRPRQQGQKSKPPKLAGANALKTWQQKLDWLQQQEAITADPAQKFALQKQIEEAEEKIVELGG